MVADVDCHLGASAVPLMCDMTVIEVTTMVYSPAWVNVDRHGLPPTTWHSLALVIGGISGKANKVQAALGERQCVLGVIVPRSRSTLNLVEQ